MGPREAFDREDGEKKRGEDQKKRSSGQSGGRPGYSQEKLEDAAVEIRRQYPGAAWTSIFTRVGRRVGLHRDTVRKRLRAFRRAND